MFFIEPEDFIHDGNAKSKGLPCSCPGATYHVTSLHCWFQHSFLLNAKITTIKTMLQYLYSPEEKGMLNDESELQK